MIEIWIRFLLLLPRAVRFWAYTMTMRHYVRLSDERLKRIVVHLMHAAVDFSTKKSDAFTEMRLNALLRAPKEVAMRHIQFMWPEITSAEFKKTAKVKATLERATLKLTKDEQRRLAELCEPFGATAFLPLDVALKEGKFSAPVETVAPKAPMLPQPMSYEELKRLMASGEPFTLVEVLTPENYRLGHLPGAINIPAEQIDTAPEKLKKDDKIVLYCRDRNCQLSPRSAEYLVHEFGFTNVHHFVGGKLEWIQRGEQLSLA